MSTVRIVSAPPGQVRHIPITNGSLQFQTLKLEFPEATGLKYFQDGVWTAVEMKNDQFTQDTLQPLNNHLFVVVDNVYVTNGPDDRDFFDKRGYIINKIRDKKPRNIAVVIGNSKFDWENDNLPAAATDIDVMTMMLSSPPFNYTVVKASNLKKTQLTELTEDVAKVFPKNLNTFLWFISTHGHVAEGHQMLKGSDCSYFKLAEVMKSAQSSSMDPAQSSSAPKVFIVNTCRLDGTGDHVDTGVLVEYGGGDCRPDENNGTPPYHGLRSGHDTKKPPPIPDTGSDIWTVNCPTNYLVVYGCPLGQQIYDFTPFVRKSISWLVHSLREVRKSIGPEGQPVNLLDLLTKANDYCCGKLEFKLEERKYTFVLEHRLTSDVALCFPPV